ncbi:DUF5677 domain-containing protein [Vibrio parahaemolyticus]|uniref:DUF5677 domain-containing protein n=1 Tax=Vibrio parahaemolyticus TaxID=670 RepID=UPI003B67F694
MVYKDDYILFYKTACNIFESTFKFINDSDEDYYFLNVSSIKLLKHIHTTEMLMTTELAYEHIEGEFTYYDLSSVVSLLRVCYENIVAIAHHYFRDNLNVDHLNFYELCGLRNRAKNYFTTSTPDIKMKIKHEQEQIDKIKTKLENNGFKIPKKNDWKPSSWYQLGLELGIPKYVCDKYSFWSSHTHTGFDSLMQVNSSHKNPPMQEIMRNEINYLFICSILVFFIKGYVAVLKRLGYQQLDDMDLSEVEHFSKFMENFDQMNESYI